jgi:hypothetical protein
MQFPHLDHVQSAVDTVIPPNTMMRVPFTTTHSHEDDELLMYEPIIAQPEISSDSSQSHKESCGYTKRRYNRILYESSRLLQLR